MKSATRSSSDFYHPGAPERAARERMDRQQRRVEQTLDRKKRFAALNDWITDRGGWCTSLPGDPEVRLECLPNSDVPAQLTKLGYELEAAGSGERILPAGRLENVRVDEDSIRTIAVSHASIAKVLRFQFPL
jgi:hypothetical protein